MGHRSTQSDRVVTTPKASTDTEPRSRHSRLIDVGLAAGILLLVLILLFMGERTCSVTMEAPMDSACAWKELAYDHSVVVQSDRGYTAANEYTFKYRSTSENETGIIVFAYVDPETGEEIADRVAYRFTTNRFGMVEVELVDVPADWQEPATEPGTEETLPVPDEENNLAVSP